MNAGTCTSARTAAKREEADRAIVFFLFLTAAFLCLLSVYDIRTKTIPCRAAPVFGAAVGILHLLLKDLPLSRLAAGLLPGAVLLFVSLAFRSMLGGGDGLVVMACGAALGPERTFAALTTAFVLCAIFSIILLLLKKVRRSDTLPFLPFLACSHIIMLIAEVIP